MAKKVFVVSLGCPKNHCDLENMMAILVDSGLYEITLNENEAEVAIINTCGFIESAKNEAISEILEMSEFKKTGNLQVLIVTGCLAQRYKDDILNEIPEVDAVVGVFDYDKIDKIATATLEGKRDVYATSHEVSMLNQMPRIQTTPFYTAFLKIAEGCDNCCAYCAIPSIRGKYKSRDIESLVLEAKKLATDGVKELIVVAQDTTRYGMDLYGEVKLISLLEELLKIDDFEWIRLHYLYPEMITDELLDFINKNDKILNYFDIPIQHINDRVLKLMNRRSTKKEISELMRKIRRLIPDAIIRTTVIVGFPTEEEAEFEELLEFIKEIKFDRLGSFIFSKEEGTKAYKMAGQISKKVKEERQKRVMEAQNAVVASNNDKEIGKTYSVLVEGYHSEYELYFGRTYKDSVDVDGIVSFSSPYNVEFGEIVSVKITGAEDYDLIGEICQ